MSILKSSIIKSIFVIFLFVNYSQLCICKEEATKKSKQYGPKKRIAVMEFENRAPGAPYDVGKGMSEMLITALLESDRFIVIERKAMDQIVEEQALGLSGAVKGGTEAKVGELLGAQVLIKGVVTEYSLTSGSAIPLSFGKIGALFGSVKGYVAMDVRMVDATTGVILSSHRSVGEVKESITGAHLNAEDFNIGGANYKKTPIGKAARKAINDAVDYIISQMEPVPWKGRVVSSSEGKVYINAGKDFGIKEGSVFKVFKKGEDLIDPETGLNLGSETTEVGIIEVQEVKDKFSIARVIKGSGGGKGDIVELMSRKEIAEAEETEYEVEEEKEIPSWRIMVVIPEVHIGRQVPDPAGETEIIRKLVEAGFFVVDQKSIEKIRYSDRVTRAIKDTEEAKSLAEEFGADVIIIGEAFSEYAGVVSSLISCRARIEARAIYVDVGKILGADGKEASDVDIAEHLAGKKALKKAGSELADYFIEKLKVKTEKTTKKVKHLTPKEVKEKSESDCENICGVLTGKQYESCISKCLGKE